MLLIHDPELNAQANQDQESTRICYLWSFAFHLFKTALAGGEKILGEESYCGWADARANSARARL